MRSFLALCPECKRSQSTRFIRTAGETDLSDDEFWLILNSRDDIQVGHWSTEGDGHDHIWTLDDRGRENALAYTKPQSDK
jgi:hypothetical protein